MSQLDRPVPSSQDALRYLGLIIMGIGSIIQIIVGFRAFELVNDKTQLSYIFMLILGFALLIGVILGILYNKLERLKINIGIFNFFAVFQAVIMLFLAPPGTADDSNLQIGNAFVIVGILILLWALKPNYGPEANKRIYQASAGIFSFIVAIFLLALGIFIAYIMNIADYAGYGTFPGDFYYSYIQRIPGGEEIHESIRGAGEIMILASLFIMAVVILRNKISLELTTIAMFAACFVAIYALFQFADSWMKLDDLFLQTANDSTTEFRPSEYNTQLRLTDPGLFRIGLVLVVLESLGALLMLYASRVAKPIEKWRIRRNMRISSAEIAIREGRLIKAIKDLESAVQWSIKIGEEDRAIELMTRIKQIEDKSTEMRKAKAIEQKKKQLEKEKMEEKKKQLKGATEKQKVKEQMAEEGAKKVE
jgi:hypothetical protein